jgi:undecaprenyl-phosphate galactose phosphotransferase
MRLNIPKYKILLAVIDFILVFLSFNISHIIINKIYGNNGIEVGLLFWIISLFVSIMFVFTFQLSNLYKINIFLTFPQQLVLIIKSLIWGSILLITFLFIIGFPFGLSSRLFLFLFITSLFVLEVLFRIFIISNFFDQLSNYKLLSRKVLIVGAGKSAKNLVAKLLVENDLGIKIIGFIDDKLPKGTNIIENIKVIGNIEDVINLNGSLKYDEVIVSIDNISYEKLLNIISIFNNQGRIVKVNSDLFKAIPENLFIEKYGSIPIINTSPQIQNSITLFFKYVFDKVFALSILILLSPFFLIIAILIKLSSKGPVLFTQKRIGKNGKEFNFYKFRSMTVVNGEDVERKEKMIDFIKGKCEKPTKIINEQRVTKIGKFLRKYSIDELPQFINVLKGEMSLVGPRPCLPYEYEHYEEWQKARFNVLPGCTGVWQVYGRSKVNFNDSVIMDLYYVNNMSPWLDLKLIFKTIPVMITGNGGK